jgi:hypothetical protein
VALAVDERQVEDGRALARAEIADEKRVHLADCGGPDRVLHQIVVQPGEGVPLICHQENQLA